MEEEKGIFDFFSEGDWGLMNSGWAIGRQEQH